MVGLRIQKKRLKNNDFLQVIDHLVAFIEPKSYEENQSPVRACHRYLNNRKDQLDYKGAIEIRTADWFRRNRKRASICYSKKAQTIGRMVEGIEC